MSYFYCPFMVCSGYCGLIFLKIHIGILFPLTMSFSECGGQFLSWPQCPTDKLRLSMEGAHLLLAISKVEGTAFL